MPTTGFVQVTPGWWLKRSDDSGPYIYDGTNMILMGRSSGAQLVAEWLSGAANTYVIPAGLYELYIDASAGAGSGGGGFQAAAGGGGGGGGSGLQVSRYAVRVVPGETVTGNVGAGGASVAQGVAGNNGNPTIVSTTSQTLLYLPAGQGGTSGTAANGGSGGNAGFDGTWPGGAGAAGAAGNSDAGTIVISALHLAKVVWGRGGAGGGGATGTNNGGHVREITSDNSGLISQGGAAAAGLGGGGAGALPLFVGTGYAARLVATGGTNASPNGVTLSTAVHGFGHGGGGGAAKAASAGTGAAGTNGLIRLYAVL